MYVRLNLATKPLEPHRRFLAGAALLGVLGSLLFLILGVRFYSLRRADEDLRTKSSQYQQEMARLEEQRRELDRFFSQGETAKLQGRAVFIRNVIEARSINWTQMFMDLEKTLPPGTRIVRIEPKLDKGVVTVKFVVGATNEEAKLKLFDRVPAKPTTSAGCGKSATGAVACRCEARRRNSEKDPRVCEGVRPIRGRFAAGEQWQLCHFRGTGQGGKDHTCPASGPTVRRKDVPGRDLQEIELDATVSGDYPSIVRFLNSLQRSNNTYIVDSLGLESESANQGSSPGAPMGLKVNLHLRTFFRKV